MQFKIENERKYDETDVFLYNIENYFLVGIDGGIDRTKLKN